MVLITELVYLNVVRLNGGEWLSLEIVLDKA